MRKLIPILALVACAIAATADEVADSRRLQQEALAAREAKDIATFLTKARAAADLRPQHPTLLVQLAAALAANGQEAAAVAALEKVAAMGFVSNLDAPELQALAKLPLLRERFAANALPIGTAREEATIASEGLIPEGMAWDGRTGRLFVSSVRTGKIFAIGRDGKAREFASAPWGAFGMAADARSRILWATTAAMPVVEGFRSEEEGQSALLHIDLDSGKVLRTLQPSDPGPHQFGDVALAPDGAVFVSDSASSTIYEVQGEKLAPFAREPFVSLQGIAPGATVLYAVDYAKGLFAIDRRTRDVHAVRVPQTASLLGVDGLYLVDSQTLVATQNGTNPNRIVRIRLLPGGLKVMGVETLLANTAELGDPTLGVLVRDRFFFNANAQWNLFGEDGKIADPLKLREAVVLSVPVR